MINNVLEQIKITKEELVKVENAPKKSDQYSVTDCPNCGAKLQVAASGVCDYCHTKISNGSHNWILANITQDEVYTG